MKNCKESPKNHKEYNEKRSNNFKKCGKSFNSNCDTEVLIESISFWGIEKTLAKISGMFSFAVWVF